MAGYGNGVMMQMHHASQEISAALDSIPNSTSATGELGLETQGLLMENHQNVMTHQQLYESQQQLIQQQQVEEPSAIDIVINNVVCSFSTRCHLNLKQIALEGYNVVYKKENGVSSLTASYHNQ